MTIYETEEEQLEAIKKWWKENGISVIGGIVIGLGLLAGWRWWHFYTDQQAQIASGIYNQVLFALEKEEIPQAEQAAGKLLSEHSGSPYAVLAALNLARQDLEKGDIDSSHARLQWVIDNSRLPELAHIARLRKARLFLSQEKVAETNSLIGGIDEATFRGAYAEIRGDIAMAQGKIDDARNAYTEAVGHMDLSSQHREWVQMKLDDLGLKKEKRIEASALSPTVSTETSAPPVVTQQSEVGAQDTPATTEPETQQSEE
ncbi:MAG: tetratricopeptide repeat protein, partial [Pseudomonadota bacterium]